MKFSVYNLGCKVNAYEAEGVAASMEKSGWERVSFEDEADAVIIFTCAVTNTAAQKSRKIMHRARRMHQGAVLVLVGCYVQVGDGRLLDADILIGTGFKEEIPDAIATFLETGRQIVRVKTLEKTSFEALPNDFSHQTRGFLKIQDGCNQFCSYCVIPYVRGRERSLAPEEAVKAAQRLAQLHSEIVLTGIHTGRYGREYGVSLSSLMREILKKADGLKRLRISSIEISEIDDGLVEVMRQDWRVARHLHIPLQAGSDPVLREMGRPYTTKAYLERITAIRRALPDVAVSCDLITGFPGESEEDFAETCSFIKQCGFSFLHVFPYSPREGTPAAERKDQIPDPIKKARAAEAGRISDALAEAYAESWVGKDVEIITEQYENGYTKGYTSQYVTAYVKGHLPSGILVRAHVLESRDQCLYAERMEA